jgi:hypothetical protein
MSQIKPFAARIFHAIPSKYLTDEYVILITYMLTLVIQEVFGQKFDQRLFNKIIKANYFLIDII